MASTLPPPSGSLLEYLEQMRLAINRAINLVGDDSILVTETTHGKELSFVGETGGGTGEAFFGRITGWQAVGDTGKRWRYSWEEVSIGSKVVENSPDDPDSANVVKNGRSGWAHDSTDSTYLINLAEMNNTTGATGVQGNGMELVAPLGGGGTDGKVEHEYKIVPIWTSSRDDGSVLYWTNVENSDHVLESSTVYDPIGESPASATDETGSHDVDPDATDFILSAMNDALGGDYLEGKGIKWEVDQRLNYQHGETTPALRSFYRQLHIRPNGKIKSVLREVATIVDTPEACP